MFKIKKYTPLENVISVIIALLIILITLWMKIWSELNEEKSYILPDIEHITEKNIEVENITKTTDEPAIFVIENIAVIEEESSDPFDGKLNAYDGIFYGPEGKETYYNLPMARVVEIMRDMGYAECDYPFNVREDGVKCLGDYVMVAADLSEHPRGSIVETSLGQGIVCDTGEQLAGIIDIAVDW